MNRRLRWALGELEALVKRTSLTEIVSIVATGNAVRPKTDSPAELLAAADRISTLTRSLLANHDGSELGSLDPLLPSRLATADIGWRPDRKHGPTRSKRP